MACVDDQCGCGELTNCYDIDTNYDPYNCGGCGSQCAWGAMCNQGTCTCACPVGTIELDGAVSNSHRST